MKHTLAASALFSLAAASPQWGGPNGGDRGSWSGQSGPFSGFPSCVSSCRDNADYSDYNNLCENNDHLSTLNTCVDGSSCSDSEKSQVKQAIVQLCANAGATITAAPFASYSATSGKWTTPTGTAGSGWRGGPPAQWAAWASSNGVTGWPTATSEWSSWAAANNVPTAVAEWQTWASQHGWGGPGRGPFGPYASNPAAWSSAASEFSAWSATNTITAWPTAPSQWSSFTSAHPMPTGLSSYAAWCQANGFPGGSAWPTAWTTNSAWASAVSAWNENGTAPSGKGWGGPGANGGHGPFGHGGPGGQGWGNGPWASSGAWTSGPWTSWWGTDGCPASSWSGWTDGPWSTAAPWTTWSGCVATTTASHVYTTTVPATDGGSAITSVATSFGIHVAQATQDLQSTTVNSDSGAVPTNMAFAGSAAGVAGVVAGALLL